MVKRVRSQSRGQTARDVLARTMVEDKTSVRRECPRCVNADEWILSESRDTNSEHELPLTSGSEGGGMPGA